MVSSMKDGGHKPGPVGSYAIGGTECAKGYVMRYGMCDSRVSRSVVGKYLKVRLHKRMGKTGCTSRMD